MIEEIYAQVPDVGCKGLCGAACGPIARAMADAMHDEARGA